MTKPLNVLKNWFSYLKVCGGVAPYQSAATAIKFHQGRQGRLLLLQGQSHLKTASFTHKELASQARKASEAQRGGNSFEKEQDPSSQESRLAGWERTVSSCF